MNSIWVKIIAALLALVVIVWILQDTNMQCDNKEGTQTIEIRHEESR